MRGCVLDLETTSLSAIGAGWILCAAIKPLEKKPIILRYDTLHDKPAHEVKLLQAIFTELSKYQLWIGHNIESFDWTFLKSRAIVLGVPMINGAFLYDTMRAFRRCGYRTELNAIGKPTARLDHTIDFFGFLQQKTRILPRNHWETVWESGKKRKEAMDYLSAHCVADVQMTEKMYWALLEQDKTANLKRFL